MGAGSLKPSPAQRLDRIARDRTKGASELAREALEVMGAAAQESPASSPAALWQEMEELAQKLSRSRPSMAPLANYLGIFLHRLAQEKTKTVDELKRSAWLLAQRLVQESQEATLRVAEQALTILAPGDRVITASYSSTVCLALEKTGERGLIAEVLAAQSRWGRRYYGEAVARRLPGLPVTVFPDKEIRAYVRRASKALVGADSLLADGSLINGTPTLELARAAQEAGLPFYVICELAKGQLDKPELEKGFDLIPASLITAVVTERGIFPPREAWRQAKTLFRP